MMPCACADLIAYGMVALSAAQQPDHLAVESPVARARRTTESIRIDGRLDEPAWQTADSIGPLRQREPIENSDPSEQTSVRVLFDDNALYVAVVCYDRSTDGIVSTQLTRDANLDVDDRLTIVLDPFFDHRNGFFFQVNPAGARSDGQVSNNSESLSRDWDGIWNAAARISDEGWVAEIEIPFKTLRFKSGQTVWGFNIERQIKRRQETDRWAAPRQNIWIGNLAEAGRLEGLDGIHQGLGLDVRPYLSGGEENSDGELTGGIDIFQNLTPNVNAAVTVNTDFAETEADIRQVNLTRFPLFFPEKRTFFIEGDDIFSFGLGLDQDVIPYFSRRIGLINGREVPILAGGKVNGRIGNTSFGGLAVGTRSAQDVVDTGAFMGVGRVKHNLWQESWVGAIATVGDPLGRPGSWLGGGDFTYATSRFRGDKNFLVGAWGLATGRQDLGSDSTAHGFTIDYPNDLVETALTYKRIGRDFDPSIGFVPRPAVQLWNATANFSPRLSHGPIQQMFFEFQPSLATDLSGRWESYRVFWAPLNWRFRSGDRVEFNAVPVGERLTEPFDIAQGVAIPRGSYEWMRYRLEAGTAQKRRLYAQVTWWFGGFYNGQLDQYQWTGAWNPKPIVTIEFSGERNVGRLATGDFTQTIAGARLRVNISPDLSIASYIQYDTDSESVGTNTRLRWTFRPVADLFIVYNHNIRSILERWRLDSNQLLIKVQYAWRL